MKQKILIAYDGTDYSLRAVEYAAGMAKMAPENFELVLFFVMPPLPIDFVEYGDLPGVGEEKDRLKKRKELLNELSKQAESGSERIFARAIKLLNTYNLKNFRHKFSHCTTDTAGEIIKELETEVYKAVVIGRKGRTSLKDRLLGGTAEKVVRYVDKCTVWVVS